MTKFSEIESIEKIEETSDVYDIEVEEIHNFFANGILVHNCVAGLPSYLTIRDIDKGKEEVFKTYDNELKPLLDIFGKERAYLEIQFNSLPEQALTNELIQEYSRRTGYKTIATADSHYNRPELWREREIYRLLARQSKGFQASPDDIPKQIDELKCELYPKNGDEMFAAYKKYDLNLDENFVRDAITRTFDIAHDFIEEFKIDSSPKLPKSFVKNRDPYLELEKLAFTALIEKDLDQNPEYVERLRRELKVIKDKDFSLYFLVLREALNEIKKEMLIGAGRGSGAGSLVCYLLDITLIDPIKNNLLFERFLSENRKEPPDIDNDLENRDEALNILRNHFGEENVVAISNFNAFQLKSLVKDVSKLYGIPFQEVNAVTSVMEQEAKQKILDEVGNDQKFYVFSFEGAKKHSPTFAAFIEKYPFLAKSIELLFRQNKSIGRHAGGVIITENPDQYVPLIKIRGEVQTPFTEGLTAKHLEPFGLIKYDFLGISTIRIIRRCIERILEKQGREVSFENVQAYYNKYLHPDSIGDGDEEIFEEIYHKGKFCATFQFSEKNAQNFCKQAKPMSVGDISVITSIYRPGPLRGGADKLYLRNRKENYDYYNHPIITEILGPTNNILCYQESFMLLAHRLAGFSLTEADELRKLLVKPLTSMATEMKQKRKEAGERFISGCIKNGLEEDKAIKLWEEDILGFISYGFNKAHAYAYSYLSYQCSFLFYHHPDEWVCSVLENEPDRDSAIAEVESVGYVVGKPDILKSGKSWTVQNKILIPSLSTIKGFGEAAAAELISIRKGWQIPDSESFGREYFRDIFESFFYDRKEIQQKKGIKIKKVWKFSKFNKRGLEALIKCEALDGLNIVGSGKLFENYAHMHRCLIENWSKKEQQKFDILALSDSYEKKDWDDGEKVEFQAELIGTFDKSLLLTEEDIESFMISDIYPISYISSSGSISCWFLLQNAIQKRTKTGKEYYKLQISDLEGNSKMLNYFGWTKEPFKKNSIYAADLVQNGDWLNVKGTIVRVK